MRPAAPGGFAYLRKPTPPKSPISKTKSPPKRSATAGHEPDDVFAADGWHLSGREAKARAEAEAEAERQREARKAEEEAVEAAAAHERQAAGAAAARSRRWEGRISVHSSRRI